MAKKELSPLAIASRDLIYQLAQGAHPDDVEAGCRDLFTNNTNGLGSVDTRVVEVASEIVRGVLAGVAVMRMHAISSATRGVSNTGHEGEEGDADRLSISERISRDVRDSDDACGSDYDSALKGAAPAARMTTEELRTRVDKTPSRKSADE